MQLTVRFASLVDGRPATVRTEDFTDSIKALEAVVAHAQSAGFTKVKVVDDEDGYHLRYTATTPGGRAGRNVAYADVGGADVEGDLS